MLELAERLMPARAALRWLYRARAAGARDADALLGFSHFHGLGTEPRGEVGLRLMTRAAQRGSGAALMRLIESMEMIGPRPAEHAELCLLCRRAAARLKHLPLEARRRERLALRRFAERLYSTSASRLTTKKYARLMRYAAELGNRAARAVSVP